MAVIETTVAEDLAASREALDKYYLALIEELQNSQDAARCEAIKEELARLTFGS